MGTMFTKGGYVCLSSSLGSNIREIAAVAKDGRIRIGSEWFTPGIPDKYGRTVRALTDEEEKRHTLTLRQTAILERLSEKQLTEEELLSLEAIADIN